MRKRGEGPGSLRALLEKQGWRSLDERLWARLETLRGGTVLIAPPLDTIPSRDGNAIYVLVEELCAGLPQPVLVIARWPNKGSPSLCGISDRILYDTMRWEPGWVEKRLPYRLKKLLVGTGAPFYLAYARRSARICRELSASIVVVEDVPVFVLVVRNIVGSEPKILLHQHADSPQSMPHRFWKKLLRAVDGIVFVAEQTRNETERVHGRTTVPTWVIYNGVDLSAYDMERWKTKAGQLRQTLGISPGDKVLLFVGRLVPHKGAAEAAEAFTAAAVPRTHFLIVGNLNPEIFGDAQYSQQLQQSVAESNGRVLLLGSQPQSELPVFFAAADIVIVPSLGREGLPKVITESVAMGVPCIVSDRGGALELVQDGKNGWVIPEPVNVCNISKTIVRAFDELQCTTVDQRLRSLVNRDRMIAQFVEFMVSCGLKVDIDHAA